MNGTNLIYGDECYALQGAVFEVYRQMGAGFLEAVYQECLELELQARGIPYQSQHDLLLSYKGTPLKHRYIPDLICYGKIIIELKATKDLAEEHQAQVFNYLRATNFKLGLLINFGHHPKVQIQRIAL
ncbi:MAG: hypothetical protein RL095_1793 [Verrucomicrobiota bacterium]